MCKYVYMGVCMASQFWGKRIQAVCMASQSGGKRIQATYREWKAVPSHTTRVLPDVHAGSLPELRIFGESESPQI